MANFFLKGTWRKEWGKSVCLLLGLVALVVILFRGPGLHYHIFVEAYRWLSTGRDPYPVRCNLCTGPILYSPAAVLFSFSFFSLFPDKVGEFLFTLVSTAFFLFALVRFLKTMESELEFSFSVSPLRHLAWLMVCSELLGAISATKPEISITAAALLGMRAIWLGNFGWAGFLFAWVCNYKFQGYPVVGLLAIPTLLNHRGMRFFVSFFLSLAFWFAIPLVYVGNWSFFLDLNRHWFEAVDLAVSRDWLLAVYQHIFGFLHGANLVTMSLPLAKKIMVGAGLTLAAALTAFGLRQPRTKLAYQRGAFLAFGMGCLYVPVFAPLSQSNAYLWYLPSVFCFLYFARDMAVAGQTAILGSVYAFVSIAYSDLVPRPVYRALYNARIKPVAALFFLFALGAVAAWELTRRPSAARS